MVHLFDVDDSNWLNAAKMSVSAEQKRFLDSALGIIARGYAYRRCNARVIGIAEDGLPVGLALVRDFTDEPLGYDLQQFLIDESQQGRGIGREALKMILAQLRQEGRFDRVEVCVDRENAAALRLFEGAGFADSGYVDPDLPHCVNLLCRL